MRIAMVLSSALALGGCGYELAPAAEDVAPLTQVEAAAAWLSDQRATREIAGTVRARSSSEVASSVMATVRQLPVAVGSTVAPGQIVARLTAKEIDAKVEQARALLAQADIDLGRVAELRARKSIAQAEYDEAVARQRLAAATLAEAEVMRGYLILRAPFAGVVAQKNAEVGDVALPGKPLLVIEDPQALRLEAAVPEALSGGLGVGSELVVHIDALGRDLSGVISEQTPTADPISRTVLIKIDLPAREPDLRPGMFGRLLLETTASGAVAIPASSLVQRGQLETVFVVQDGKAKLRLVRSGRRHARSIDLLSGLEAGELVVISHPERLRDGQPVLTL